MNERLPAEVAVASGRFVVRRYVDDDIEPLGRAIATSLEHLRRFMPWAAHEPLSSAARRELFATWDREWAAGTSAVYGMFADGEVIGGCGLHRRRAGHPEVVEIGYWVHVDHVRQGIAGDAAAALTNAALSVPGITAVEIWHEPDNVASEGVPRKLGYVYVGEETREATTFKVWRLGSTRSPARDG